MRDIRLRWVSIREMTIDSQPVESGPWCSDTVASRHELGAILEVGQQEWGEGSHWIEERESDPLKPVCKG
jgi:hypothetical protein